MKKNEQRLKRMGEWMNPSFVSVPHHKNRVFTGQENVLSEMFDALNRNVSDLIPVHVISGMTGVGKTQAVVEFLYRYRLFFGGGIYWFDFSNPDQIEEQFLDCKEILPKEMLWSFPPQWTGDRKLDYVQSLMSDDEQRLFVFDGLDQNCLELLEKWKPKTGGGSVIVTSRNSIWPTSSSITQHHLRPFDQETSRIFLQELADGLNDSDANQIANIVGFLPAALYAAGIYFEYSFDSHYTTLRLEKLNNEGLNCNAIHMGGTGRGLGWSPTNYHLTIKENLDESWNQLLPQRSVTDQLAVNIMICASQSKSKNVTISHLMVSLSQNEKDVRSAIQRLQTLGLIERDYHTKSVFLHPFLTQYVLELGLNITQNEWGQEENSIWKRFISLFQKPNH